MLSSYISTSLWILTYAYHFIPSFILFTFLPLHSMDSFLYSLLIFVALPNLCFSSVFGDECKVHIDNRHTELKEFIGNQTQFTWTNWSHLILLLMLALLVCLLVLAYCYIKIKFWPTIKHNHSPSSFNQCSAPSSTLDPPYIIQVRDRAPQPHPPARDVAHDDG